MQYYIQEWQEDSVSLITDDDYLAGLFESMDDAIEVYAYDCVIQPVYRERKTTSAETGQDNPDLDYIY